MLHALLNRGAVVLALLLASGHHATAAQPPQPASTSAEQTRLAQELFTARYEDFARLYPEFATFRGDTRYGHLWTDASPEGISRSDAWWRDIQRRSKAIDRDRLSPGDRVSLDLLVHDSSERVQLQEYEGFRSMSVGAAPFAFQSSFTRLLQASPANTKAQAEQILTRMRTYPQRIDQETARLRAGMSAGWVPSKASLERALSQLDGQLAGRGDQSPFFQPFTKLGSGISAEEGAALKQRAHEAIAQYVLPATQRLRDFIAGEYSAAAPSDGSLARYPSGEQVYALLVRAHTTTALTPKQIHEIGLREVARLRSEIEALMRSTGFKDDFAAFVTFLNSDPKFFYESGEALLSGYRDIAKRIDPELPRLFADLPRTPYGIRPLPEFMGAGGTETYMQPAADGSRPGWFNANVLAYKQRPKWAMETLTAHEAVPGHHLQQALAVEASGVPAFRRVAYFTAFNEGWALYAETLGPGLGLYQDPYSRFGFLQAQMLRAARLVVDTGIHAFGWSRQQAIDYLAENTGRDLTYVTSEIDRYYAWPGQALAYMIGQLQIIELRDRSKAALGESFDIRQFHRIVLESGQVPLYVLEQLVNEWLASKKKSD